MNSRCKSLSQEKKITISFFKFFNHFQPVFEISNDICISNNNERVLSPKLIFILFTEYQEIYIGHKSKIFCFLEC